MTDPLVPQITQQLAPPLRVLIDKLIERDEPLSAVFFSNLRTALDRASSEEDLLMFSLELSQCAFVGLDYGEESAAEIDRFLALAEAISHVMSAQPGTAH
ncbi:MAG: hypothetical protein NXH85_03975 [Pseudomonadaceae bacterium]|nr:hypothetical protein [Pseudomonadaceae bacterium]